jgi:alpha-beta hydrolase superfamily lysophospholipase
MTTSSMQRQEWPFTASDGIPLWGSTWRPPTPHAVVGLVHGAGEHSGRYGHVAQTLNDAGYAMAAFDLRGHGHSGGLRGHAPDYDALLDDIDLFLQETRRRFLELPVFLYGHSLGGNLVLNYCLRRNPPLAGVIVTSPWLSLLKRPPRWKVITGRVLDWLRPTSTFSRGNDPTALSRDPAVIAAYRRDPLVHDRISARLYFALASSGAAARKQADQFHLPLLLMHGAADPVTSPFASQAFCNTAPSCTFRLWPRLRHELHNELERDAVLAEVVAWLDGCLEGRA